MTVVRLRPPTDDDRVVLLAWSAAPEHVGEFGRFGLPARAYAQAMADPVVAARVLVVEVDGELVGSVSWQPVTYGPVPATFAWNIGISLDPPFRGRGVGTKAQRSLADMLFATTAAHRVEAGTDVGNLAEQRALEKAGFRREGVLRGAQWRAGQWHDLVSFARLRTD